MMQANRRHFPQHHNNTQHPPQSNNINEQPQNNNNAQKIDESHLFSSSLGSGSLKLRGHHGGGGLRGVTPTTATAEEVEMSLAKPPRSLSVSHHQQQHQQN